MTDDFLLDIFEERKEEVIEQPKDDFLCFETAKIVPIPPSSTEDYDSVRFGKNYLFSALID